jgi:hypothetical protein
VHVQGVHRFDCRWIQRKPNTRRAHTRTLSTDIRQVHERAHSARVRGHAHSRAAVRFHGSPPQPRILQAIAGMHACLHARHSGTATDLPLMGADGWLQKYTFPAESRMSDLCTAEAVYRRCVCPLHAGARMPALVRRSHARDAYYGGHLQSDCGNLSTRATVRGIRGVASVLV